MYIYVMIYRTVRSIAMIIYYAEHEYFNTYGSFTNDVTQLSSPDDVLKLGGCTHTPTIHVYDDGKVLLAVYI